MCGIEGEARYVIPSVLQSLPRPQPRSPRFSVLQRQYGRGGSGKCSGVTPGCAAGAIASAASEMRASLSVFHAHQDCLNVTARDSPDMEVSYLTGKSQAPLTKHRLPLLRRCPDSPSRLLREAPTFQASKSCSKVQFCQLYHTSAVNEHF